MIIWHSSMDQKKCLCGIHYLMLRDLGKVPSTGALCNRHIDLQVGCGHCEPVAATLGHGPEPMESNCLRQSSVDERAFVEVQVSSRETPAYHCSERKKNIWVVYVGEGKRNSFTLPISHLPQGGTAQGQERPSWPLISPTVISESMWVSTRLPQLCGMLPKRLISPWPHPEYWVASCMTEVWEEAGKMAHRTLAGTWIYYTGHKFHQEVLQQATEDTLSMDTAVLPRHS